MGNNDNRVIYIRRNVMELKGSKTAINLMKSFAGECQARTRYTYYSTVAEKAGYIQISKIFTEIASQEEAHSRVYYNFLKDAYADEAIDIEAAYPVSLHEDTMNNLRAAAAAEHLEWSNDYPEFARVAREEGFIEIAVAFESIGKVEEWHEKTYNKLSKSIEDGTVFSKAETVMWKCDNCGYIYEGKIAPKKCPACGYPQGYFSVYVESN